MSLRNQICFNWKFPWLYIVIALFSLFISDAFTVQPPVSTKNKGVETQTARGGWSYARSGNHICQSQPDPNENGRSNEKDKTVNNNDDDNNKENESIFARFTNPRIDDPALPLSDVLVAQVIAPSLQAGWLALNKAPLPSWLRPIFVDRSSLFGVSYRGSFVAPALIHGAALAVCWVTGALAAKAYEADGILMGKVQDESENGELKTLTPVIVRVLKAGAFATGLLILATQIDLFLESGGTYVQYGASEETDFRIQVAVVELVNDVFFEAMSLLTWRVYLAVQTDRNSGA